MVRDGWGGVVVGSELGDGVWRGVCVAVRVVERREFVVGLQRFRLRSSERLQIGV